MTRDRGRAGERRNDRKRERADRSPLARRRAYRAAQEVLEQGYDLWKMADNKARLALLLLGPLNVILLALLSHSDLFDAIPQHLRLPVVVGVVVYAALAMTMFLLAIGTLRPERAEPVVQPPRTGGHDGPLGIRHYEDILRRDLHEYQTAWREVHIGQLVSEIAEQAHAVAQANRRKFHTLYQLFRGLQGMTALAVIIVLITGLAVFVARRADDIPTVRKLEQRAERSPDAARRHVPAP
jgi:hypothetical protein